MNTIHSFFVTIFALLMSGFEAFSQEEQKLKVDPGVSVHNYKHPHKARRAQKLELQKIRRRGHFHSGVGIGRRAIIAPDAQFQRTTPKYKRRPFLVFPERSKPTPTRLNPLTNPANYKTQH